MISATFDMPAFTTRKEAKALSKPHGLALGSFIKQKDGCYAATFKGETRDQINALAADLGYRPIKFSDDVEVPAAFVKSDGTVEETTVKFFDTPPIAEQIEAVRKRIRMCFPPRGAGSSERATVECERNRLKGLLQELVEREQSEKERLPAIVMVPPADAPDMAEALREIVALIHPQNGGTLGAIRKIASAALAKTGGAA